MEGLDEPWQDDGTERSVSYRNLSPGNYRFQVSATIEPGTGQGQSAELPFEVKPLLLETTWFRAGAALTFALLVGAAFRVRLGVLERKRAAQEQFSRQLMQQQEAERKRIAAELHDSLGQSLSIIQNHAVLAGSQGDANGHVEGISQAATEALASVREICHALRPVELDRLGLSKTLRAMAERLGASSGLLILAEIDPVDSLVSTDNRIHVLRFVQEAFNNIVKHARATQVKISLREDDDCLHLVICDDGCGFDPAATGGRSLGLNTMEERSRILGAALQIKACCGEGTTLRLDLPVARPPQGDGKMRRNGNSAPL
jgi:signal transduction histidine kinase